MMPFVRFVLPGAIVALIAFPSISLAGDGTFGAKTDLTVGAVPSSATVGDFNSDGISDVVAANQSDDDISVLLGLGSGAFGAKTDFPVGDVPKAVAVGDFNSDGAEDLAVANSSDDDVSILLGTGTGGFGSKTDFPVGNDPRSLAIGDFDGDRAEDLAVANLSDGDVSILLGAGNGSFGTKTDFPVSHFPPAIAVGDFDSDGFDDLVTPGGINGKGVSVLLNKADGSGGFETKTDFLTGDDPFGVAVGDLDSDGFEDLAATNQIDDDISVLLGSGDGSFGAEMDFPVGNGPGPLETGDFNSDGAEDLAVANRTDNDVSILLGTGNGGFGAKTDFPVGPSPTSIALGDLSSDDNLDIVTPSLVGGSDDISVLPGQGAPYLAGNLLINGGAEGAGATRSFAGTPQIPGWTRGPSGSFTHIRYPFRGAFSHLTDSARWEGDLGLFAGGPVSAPPSTTSQTVGVDASAGSIDAGIATARLAADLGGYRTRGHRMEVTATFRDGSGGALGTFTIGPVTVADRHNITQLIRRTGQAAVPPGTRSMEVSLKASYDGSGLGTYVEAYGDNVKLTLDAPEPPPAPGGDTGGGSGAGTGGGVISDTDSPETSKGKGPKRKIEKRKATFEFSSDEPGSSFECALDKKPPKPCTSPAKVKKLKDGKHTFTTTAIDPAGNRDSSPAVWKFKVER